MRKKLRFEPKTSKNWVFWYIQVYTKTIRNFIVRIRWCSNSQDRHPIRCASCSNNKKGNFKGKKLRFEPNPSKTLTSWGFLLFAKTLRFFTVSVRWRSNLQNSRSLERKRLKNNKLANCGDKKKRFRHWNTWENVTFSFSTTPSVLPHFANLSNLSPMLHTIVPLKLIRGLWLCLLAKKFLTCPFLSS